MSITYKTKDLHLTTTASIEVFIQDIDDNPPAFDHPRYDVKIPENVCILVFNIYMLSY